MTCACSDGIYVHVNDSYMTDAFLVFKASKANLKRFFLVFSEDLKCCCDLDFRIARGKAFHRTGAVPAKDLSPNDRKISSRGRSSRIPSFERK